MVKKKNQSILKAAVIRREAFLKNKIPCVLIFWPKIMLDFIYMEASEKFYT
jgi:hypothetical protein